MPEYDDMTDQQIQERISTLVGQHERYIETLIAAGAPEERAKVQAVHLYEDAQALQKALHRRRAAIRADEARSIEDAIIAAFGRDYSAMDDYAIKQAKGELWALRQKANPQQDAELRAEMIRAQQIINARSRERVREAYATAAATPGAVSTWIMGDQATATAEGTPSGGN